ncbi:MAG: TatD family hydrolase [Saccharofermentans sp.]|nr:TatD family hydrolase [Saccharofermentans sp.]
MKEPVRYINNGYRFFDTHAHLYDERFAQEGITPEDILRNASEAGVERILIPADNLDTSRKAVSYVKDHDGKNGIMLYCSVGVHPHEASSWSVDVKDELYKLLAKREELKIRAVGEIGLDYHYDFSPRDIQRKVYEEQLLMAYELDIPIILHEREAAGDSMDILRRLYKAGNMRKNVGVCHCCSASPEIASELVKMGFYIGFDGPITFKNNKNTPAVCAAVPLERIVIETDSPYLTPVPDRGLTNEPCYVPFVLEKIAQIKEITTGEAAEAVMYNALSLYEITEG